MTLLLFEMCCSLCEAEADSALRFSPPIPFAAVAIAAVAAAILSLIKYSAVSSRPPLRLTLDPRYSSIDSNKYIFFIHLPSPSSHSVPELC